MMTILHGNDAATRETIMDWAISSQASHRLEGSTTIPSGSSAQVSTKHAAPKQGDDIVWPLGKAERVCTATVQAQHKRQEKTAPVYIMATANEVGKLPPEMLRKGRFDELWFVDLPSQIEREAILRIHIERTGRDLKKFKGWEKLAGAATMGYTGAELEAIVKQAMFDAFSEKRREFTTADIEKAISQTVPLIKTKAAEIEALRKWASNKARQANIGETVKVSMIPEKKGGGVFLDTDDTGLKGLTKRTRGRLSDG